MCSGELLGPFLACSVTLVIFQISHGSHPPGFPRTPAFADLVHEQDYPIGLTKVYCDRGVMSLILKSSSQISSLEGLRLSQVYPLPRVYSHINEIPYPAGTYLLPPVYLYREGSIQAGTTQQKTEMSEGRTHTEAPKKTTSGNSRGSMDSSDILYRQEVLLKHLKKVREEVDTLERALRKDPSQKPSSQPSQSASVASPADGKSSSNSSAPTGSLSESLKKMSGDRSAMQELLLHHGASLLTRLKHLRGKLDNFSNDSSHAGNKAEKRRKIVINSVRTRSTEKTQELVVVADPQKIPLSFLSAANMLASKFAVATNTFVHSSVQVPEHLRGFLDSAASTDSMSNADFVLTLIWKEMKNCDTSLMVDASRQTVPIISEANVVRYILRLLDDKYDSPEHSKDYIANEKWLNTASRQVVYGNSKERQSAIRQLNGHLGKSSFLTNTSAPTLVDIALLSALLQTQCSLVGNVKKWAVACRHSDLLANTNISLSL